MPPRQTHIVLSAIRNKKAIISKNDGLNIYCETTSYDPFGFSLVQDKVNKISIEIEF
jgi:hypothetical protein